MSRPIRSGHRGAGGLAPANTLVSFRLALELGCDLVEMDIRRVASGELVLFHDDAIARHGARQPVGSMTLDELRAALGETGREITLLEPALDLLHGRAVPLLDLKGVGFERQLAQAVRGSQTERAIVCGGPLASLLATRAANPAIATSLTLEARALASLDTAGIAAIPTDAVTVDFRGLDCHLVGLMHEAALTVIAWTVDGPDDMQRLLGWGVDGITTNRPDLLSGLCGDGPRH